MTCNNCTSVTTVTGVLTNTKRNPTSSVTFDPRTNTLTSNNNNTSNTCPTNRITHIGKVGNYIVVTLDDCTFYRTTLDKLDLISFTDISEVVTNVEKIDSVINVTKTNLLTGEEVTYELP